MPPSLSPSWPACLCFPYSWIIFLWPLISFNATIYGSVPPRHYLQSQQSEIGGTEMGHRLSSFQQSPSTIYRTH